MSVDETCKHEWRRREIKFDTYLGDYTAYRFVCQKCGKEQSATKEEAIEAFRADAQGKRRMRDEATKELYGYYEIIKELQDKVKELEQRIKDMEEMHDVAKECEDHPQIPVKRDDH